MKENFKIIFLVSVLGTLVSMSDLPWAVVESVTDRETASRLWAIVPRIGFIGVLMSGLGLLFGKLSGTKPVK